MLALEEVHWHGSSPSLQNKDPGGGVGSTSRGWRLVGLGMEMGGFRDQGVDTGRDFFSIPQHNIFEHRVHRSTM